MPRLNIEPPVLNSANPWCTTLEQLEELYNCPHTGAITTRTSLLDGYPDDPLHHQYAFFNPTNLAASPPNTDSSTTTIDATKTASLNTLGYSPLPLSDYLRFVEQISDKLKAHHPSSSSHKPIILSVTGTAPEITQCYRLIATLQPRVLMPLAMEINLSCPNIPGHPPPAYNSSALSTYLSALNTELGGSDPETIAIGIKTPPYTYADQFTALVNAIMSSLVDKKGKKRTPVSFITATNTLGECMLLDSGTPTVTNSRFKHTLMSTAGSGIGGLGGAPLHPLALGNVYEIKRRLLQHEELINIQIIGTGGVEDSEGFGRMRAVGASAVGVGTAFGRKGVVVFEEIGKDGWD
ncbi:dihydroorotate dehydrogenase [Pyrenophora seminiperda CCB06]|uniref:Dihydroorotate dehydrogenase (fumarate) n=1 Tax=Pyrenophora seminiperda CCB06 TaxID=1302712 RepID=A0A3M7MGD8_9PLEO|nr:dihydroorotate dehydrogenase [Pyrenophora seminiperda CCB06]